VKPKARTRSPIRFRGRSFMAIVLAPEPPTDEWFVELDALVKRSPAFFVSRPVILDVAALPQEKAELTALIAELTARDIRVLGMEGADPSLLGLGFPPPLGGGRPVPVMLDTPEKPANGKGNGKAEPAPAPAKEPTSLVVENPVRSGQSVVFPEGDVTIVGSVASGAEIVAGGSIHIYGALRGRAIAGSTGNGRARIYCNKLEAELLAIDGLYKTADDMEAQFRGRPVQAWLNGEAIMMAALD
jgi:septum site-determining protein MinC